MGNERDSKGFEILSLEQIREKCFDELRTATNPDDILLLKRGLIQLTVILNPDDVEGMFGIKIVEKSEGELRNIACSDYTLGRGVNVEEFHNNMFNNFRESEVPVAGAYAFYTFLGVFPKHIGQVTERGTVISKWGLKGHVYEHDPLMVPLQYGDKVTYYSPC